MFGLKSKKYVAQEKYITTYCLDIFTKSGNNQRVTELNENISFTSAFSDFVNWFLKHRTKYFEFKNTNCVLLISREDIVGYKISKEFRKQSISEAAEAYTLTFNLEESRG